VPAPEPLLAVDVDLALIEVLLVVHLQLSVAAEHEIVVAVDLVHIDHAATTDLLHGEPRRQLASNFDPFWSSKNDPHLFMMVRFPAPGSARP